MGQYEKINAETGLPMRRLSIPQRGGGERGFWIYDTSDIAVASWVSAGITGIKNAPGHEEDLSFIESVQYWPDEPG